MNSKQAKQVPIIDLMAGLKHEPSRIENGCYWYKSPLRDEKEASFKVDLNKNVWYDFGSGEGGTIIDLVVIIAKCNISEALRIIELYNTRIPTVTGRPNIDVINKPISSFDQQKINKLKIKDIEDKYLIQYACYERCIDKEILLKYCKEGAYTISGSTYNHIVFMNDKGGYELRNRVGKYNLGGKGITTIINDSNIKSNRIIVFEGFFDFLSYQSLRLWNKSIEENEYDCLIMNSLSLVEDAITQMSNWDEKYLFLDNDNAGKLNAKIIVRRLKNVTDCSSEYKDYDDLNEYLKCSCKGWMGRNNYKELSERRFDLNVPF